jgi:hypothetical protein
MNAKLRPALIALLAFLVVGAGPTRVDAQSKARMAAPASDDECAVYAAALQDLSKDGVVSVAVYSLAPTDKPDVDVRISCHWDRYGLSLPNLIEAVPTDCAAAQFWNVQAPLICPPTSYQTYFILGRPQFSTDGGQATLAIHQRGPANPSGHGLFMQGLSCSFIKQGGKWQSGPCKMLYIT